MDLLELSELTMPLPGDLASKVRKPAISFETLVKVNHGHFSASLPFKGILSLIPAIFMLL
jgi:hypothetical protein